MMAIKYVMKWSWGHWHQWDSETTRCAQTTIWWRHGNKSIYHEEKRGQWHGVLVQLL